MKAKTSQLNAIFPIQAAMNREHSPHLSKDNQLNLYKKSALTALSAVSQKAEVSLCAFQFPFFSLYKCHS